VNYYAREGSKINANGAVYGLSSGKIAETKSALTADELEKIRSSMLSFSKGIFPEVNLTTPTVFKEPAGGKHPSV